MQDELTAIPEKNNTKKKWYALYTKPRWEKKIFLKLVEKGIEAWCPTRIIEKKWTDRKKKIEEPLFRSYIFVRIDMASDERMQVLQTVGILNFVFYLSKPAIIKDEEVALIKRYLSEETAQIALQSTESFQKDHRIRVVKGVFMDKEGKVIKANGKRVYVLLETLGQVMMVEFSKDQVERAS